MILRFSESKHKTRPNESEQVKNSLFDEMVKNDNFFDSFLTLIWHFLKWTQVHHGEDGNLES